MAKLRWIFRRQRIGEQKIVAQNGQLMMKRFLVITILLVNADRLSAERLITQGIPPTCTPLPAQPISYLGATTGCTSQIGGNHTCIAGEVIQFKYGDGVNACCPAGYLWQFEGAPISNGASGTINHQFRSAGNFTVTATVTSCNPVTVTLSVPVAPASSIPAVSHTLMTLLVFMFAAVALRRLA